MTARPWILRRTAVWVVSAALVACGGCSDVKIVKAEALSETRNLDFEGGAYAGNLPNGWILVRDGGTPDDYSYDVDREKARSGAASLRIRFVGTAVRQHGGVAQCLQQPEIEAGSRLSLAAFVKTVDAPDGGASIWMTAWDPANKVIEFRNVGDGRVRGTTDWTRQKVTIEIGRSRTVDRLCVGFFHDGRGTAWVDDVTLKATRVGSS